MSRFRKYPISGSSIRNKKKLINYETIIDEAQMSQDITELQEVITEDFLDTELYKSFINDGFKLLEDTQIHDKLHYYQCRILLIDGSIEPLGRISYLDSDKIIIRAYEHHFQLKEYLMKNIDKIFYRKEVEKKYYPSEKIIRALKDMYISLPIDVQSMNNTIIWNWIQERIKISSIKEYKEVKKKDFTFFMKNKLY